MRQERACRAVSRLETPPPCSKLISGIRSKIFIEISLPVVMSKRVAPPTLFEDRSNKNRKTFESSKGSEETPREVLDRLTTEWEAKYHPKDGQKHPFLCPYRLVILQDRLSIGDIMMFKRLVDRESVMISQFKVTRKTAEDISNKLNEQEMWGVSQQNGLKNSTGRRFLRDTESGWWDFLTSWGPFRAFKQAIRNTASGVSGYMTNAWFNYYHVDEHGGKLADHEDQFNSYTTFRHVWTLGSGSFQDGTKCFKFRDCFDARVYSCSKFFLGLPAGTLMSLDTHGAGADRPRDDTPHHNVRPDCILDEDEFPYVKHGVTHANGVLTFTFETKDYRNPGKHLRDIHSCMEAYESPSYDVRIGNLPIPQVNQHSKAFTDGQTHLATNHYKHLTNWKIIFKEVKEWKEKTGHFNFPKDLRSSTGCLYGKWIYAQRDNVEGLSTEQIHLLKSIGFSFHPWDDAFMEKFARLYALYKKSPHNRFRNIKKEDDEELQNWVRNLRNKCGHSYFKKQKVERQAMLDEIGFIYDNFEEKVWFYYCNLLKKCKEEGMKKIPKYFMFEGVVPLGNWVHNLPRAYRNNRLSQEKLRKLGECGIFFE